MQRPLDDVQAEELRALTAKVTDAVEARIRGDVAAAEVVRRATQDVQIAAMGPFEYYACELWQELNVLPAINDHGDCNVTAANVAKKTGADELLIARIMRVLTAVGICQEISPNTYKANELSRIAASQGGMAGIKHTNELLFPVAATLVPYMRQHGFKQFPRRPDEMDPLQFAFNGNTIWDHFRENKEPKQWFDTLMAENRKGNTPWFQIYPFADEIGQSCSEQPDGVLLVDVGGNRGGDILETRQTYPNLPGRFILQDLPETLAAVDKASLPGIEIQPYDFFTPQTVKGAKAYFWRWVLHDFGDEEIQRFLSNTVQAMDGDSKLLLMELVLPDIGADVKGSHLDILMMLYHSGMERSLGQWMNLIESCGLELVKVWSRPDTDPCVLECRKKQGI